MVYSMPIILLLYNKMYTVYKVKPQQQSKIMNCKKSILRSYIVFHSPKKIKITASFQLFQIPEISKATHTQTATTIRDLAKILQNSRFCHHNLVTKPSI